MLRIVGTFVWSLVFSKLKSCGNWFCSSISSLIVNKGLHDSGGVVIENGRRLERRAVNKRLILVFIDPTFINSVGLFEISKLIR